MPKPKRQARLRKLTKKARRKIGQVFSSLPVKTKGIASSIQIFAKPARTGKRRIEAIALVQPRIAIGKGKMPAISQTLLAEGKHLFLKKVGNLQGIADFPGARQVRAVIQTCSGKPKKIVLDRGSFSEQSLGIQVAGRLSESAIRAGIKTGELQANLNHTLGSGAGVLVVGNSLFVQQRSRTTHPVSMRGKIHPAAGRVKEKQQPHRVALDEVSLETGIPKKRLEIVGANGKKLSGKNHPFVLVREVRDSAFATYHIMKVKGREQSIVEKFFSRNSDGSYSPKQAPEKSESMKWHRMANTKEAIAAFIQKNRSKLSPSMHIFLSAYSKT